MIVESIPIKTLWGAIRWLPSLFLRWHFTSTRLASLIYCDLQPRQDPATVDLGPCASFDVWLQVINLSPFPVEIDRGSFSFWCGGSVLKASSLNRKPVGPGEIVSLHLREVIPDSYANQMVKVISDNYCALEGHIDFNCKIRTFSKNIGHLGYIRPRILNDSSRSVNA